jgi:peroxiredoxin
VKNWFPDELEIKSIIVPVKKYLRLLSSHTSILSVLLIVSVVINISLARKTKRLQASLDTIASGKRILLGTAVPPLQATNMSGESVNVSYADSERPTVIYVFSASCGWCEKNLENIKFLATSLKGSYRFVGLSIDRDRVQLEEYMTKTNLPFPVYHSPPTATWTDYRLGATPMTIVVSPEGKVIEDWSGAYAEPTREEVESFFKIKLPGIPPMSSDRGFQTVH